MAGVGLLIPILLLVGLFVWFRQSQGEKPLVGPRQGRVSLLTEAVSYIGAILVLAGAGAAIVQRWDELAEGTRLGLLAGLTLFFLGVGAFTMRSTDPAFVRLTSVVWLIGTAGVAGASSLYFVQIVETSDETSFLAVAAITTGVAALLYAIRREVLQHLAMYGGVLVTAFAVLTRIDPEYPAWVGAMIAWGIGLGWIFLGRRRLVAPWWVAMPVGMITALMAPSAIQESSFGVMSSIGIGTAAGLMAFSVYGKFVPGLALGSVGLFAYVTGAVVHYFGDALGVPAALALTGAVILVLAAVSARLVRFTRTPPAKPGTEQPSVTLPKAS